jgi:hypothetical protein
VTHATVSEVRACISRVRESGLADQSPEARVDAIVRLARAMLQLESTPELGALATSSALSEPMTRWCIRTTFEGVTREVLSNCRELAEIPGHRSIPLGVTAVILSGNLLTSPTRALLLPLLMGVPVVARVSARESAFASTLKRTLSDGCPSMRALGAGLALVEFDHTRSGGQETLRAFLGAADMVSVYGSDETCADVQAMVPMGVPVAAHGHGLGMGVLTSSGNTERALDATIAGFALDVAAYDQRGCLSPQALFVEENGWVSPEGVAARLHEALGEVHRRLPRGHLSPADAARQAQFRGVGAALGRVFASDAGTVTYEGSLPPRASPGLRNISVHSYVSEAHLLGLLSPLGRHLKAVGLAADAPTRERFIAALPPALVPRVCAPGDMQTPPFAGLWDGLPPWHGLLRYMAR